MMTLKATAPMIAMTESHKKHPYPPTNLELRVMGKISVNMHSRDSVPVKFRFLATLLALIIIIRIRIELTMIFQVIVTAYFLA